MKYEKTYTFPKKGNWPAKTVTLREATGQDEQAAMKMSEANLGKTSFREEMVRACITQLDGQPVPYPFTDFDNWPSKARALVSKAFDKMNMATDEDEADFFGNGD